MEDELRDIKPLLEIPDGSYYLFLALVFLGIAFVLAIVGILVKKFWRKKKVDMKKVYFHALENLDWTNVKQSAYEATELGRILTFDNEQAKEIYLQLVPLLESYKYRKEVPVLDEETLSKYNLLVNILDESI